MHTPLYPTRLPATKLEVEAGKITGRIAGMNCHGIEKVNRIPDAVDLSKL
jgi:phosphoserine phosphatase